MPQSRAFPQFPAKLLKIRAPSGRKDREDGWSDDTANGQLPQDVEVEPLDTTYTMQARISSYDVGPGRRLRPAVAFMLMQEAAGLHLEGDGLSYERMRRDGIVFLLVREAVRALRWPRYGEAVTVKTWFEKTAGAKFLRGYRFFDEKGGEVLAAQSEWVIAEPATHRILRPREFPFTMPEAGEPAPVPIRRIRLPETLAPAGGRRVRYSDIDCNRHMNNAVYVDLLCDYYPGGLGEREPSALQIEYEGEATLGETIDIATAPDLEAASVLEAAPAPEEPARDAALFSGTVAGRRCFTARAELAPPPAEI